LSAHPQLAQTVQEAVAQADVCHIHALWENIQHFGARAAERRGVPYIVRPCGMLDPWSLRQSKWKKQLYMAWRLRRNLQRAAALHFTAAAERDLTKPLKLSTPAIVEPNGVDLKEFEQLPPRGTFRSAYPAIGQRPMILFLGRVHPKKGVDLLVKAFSKTTTSDAMLVIAGPDWDGHTAQIRQLVQSLGLTDRVIFTGMLHGRHRIEAMVDADLFCLASHSENFGIAVVEALAAGTPVIISDQVNIYQEIAAAGVGTAVPLDVSAFTSSLDRWLADRSLRQEAASRCRDFVWQNYDWNQIARRWIEHYVRLRSGQRTIPAAVR
jgi:glycosyltransferase involved in cell wall biosynthesis